MRRGTRWLAGLAMAGAVARGQGAGRATQAGAQTSGSCSPVITGGTSQVTIQCSGMSNEKANQMIRLMNGILARQIDMKELDGQLGHIQDELAALRKTMAPLADQPPAVKALVDEGYLAYTQCMTFTQDWSQRYQEAMLRSVQSPRTGADAAAKDPYAVNFRKDYVPRLQALEVKYRQYAPAGLPPRDLAHLDSVMDASQYVRYVQGLARAGQRQAMNGLTSPELLLAARQQSTAENAVFAEANEYTQAWMGASRPTTVVNPTAGAREAVDAEEAERYRTTLQPKLEAFRDKLELQVPEYATHRSYAVTGLTQISGVCMDVATMGSAYLRKLTGDPSASVQMLMPHR